MNTQILKVTLEHIHKKFKQIIQLAADNEDFAILINNHYNFYETLESHNSGASSQEDMLLWLGIKRPEGVSIGENEYQLTNTIIKPWSAYILITSEVIQNANILNTFKKDFAEVMQRFKSQAGDFKKQKDAILATGTEEINK